MPDLQPAQLFLFDRPVQGGPPLSEEMRNNFEALARTMLTDSDAYPSAPRKGMVRIFEDAGPPAVTKYQWYDGGTWRTMLQKIEGGVAAPAKLLIDITTPLAVWTIDHNLGSRPVVQVFDSPWNQLQPVFGAPGAGQYSLLHVNENRVVITHPGAQDGHAIILG